MYFEINDTNTSIYYLNDDTGTEKYISIDADGEMVFEYEDYMPNAFIGKAKARWQLSKFSGFSTIKLEAGSFISSDKYIVDDTTEISESDTFKIEAKNYVYYTYDELNEEYIEEVNPTWFYRTEGTWAGDQSDLFNLPSFLNPIYTYDVFTSIQTLDTNKELITVLAIPFLDVTKQDLLDYIAE